MPRHRAIRDVWESATGLQLGPHLAAFYGDPLLRDLARFSESTLTTAAELVVADTGRLRLSDWLAYCRSMAGPQVAPETLSRPRRRESRRPVDGDLHRRVSEILAERPP